MPMYIKKPVVYEAIQFNTPNDIPNQWVFDGDMKFSEDFSELEILENAGSKKCLKVSRGDYIIREKYTIQDKKKNIRIPQTLFIKYSKEAFEEYFEQVKE